MQKSFEYMIESEFDVLGAVIFSLGNKFLR